MLAHGVAKKKDDDEHEDFLFTDSRASLDGPGGWAKGWIFNGNNCPTWIRHQHSG